MANDLSSFSCDTPDCISPNAINLKITPVLDNSGTFYVNSKVSAFNLGGTCNEGGFPSNTVKWELLRNNAVVRSSDSLGQAVSSCKNGRFYLYVNLGAANGLPDLTPLPGGYQLRVTLNALGATAANAQASAVVTLSVK